MDAPPPLLDDAVLALLRRRVSIVVASRDADLQPRLMRALALRVDADRRRVAVLLARRHCAALLDAIAAHRAVAVVVTEPSTHRTAQLKGRDAAIEAASPGDVALVRAHAERFADELHDVGFTRAFARVLLDPADGELVAVGFTPSEVFDQTPGPGAGRPLGAGAVEAPR